VFYHCFSFTFYGAKGSKPPESFTISMFDKGSVRDHPLGSVVVPITAAHSKPRPPFQWEKLTGPAGGEVQFQAVVKTLRVGDPDVKHHLEDLNVVGLAMAHIADATIQLPLGHSESFLVVEHGLESYKGKPISGTSPLYNQKCALWVRAGEEKYLLRLSVYSPSAVGHPVLVGRGYVDLSGLRAGVSVPFVVEIEPEAASEMGDNTFSQFSQALEMEEGVTDPSAAFALQSPLPGGEERKDAAPAAAGVWEKVSSTPLGDLGVHSSTKGTGKGGDWADKAGSLGKAGVVGKLNVSILFRSRSQLDSWFFKRLMDYFDTDHDGTLDKEEWSLMFETLSGNVPSDTRTSLGSESQWGSLFDTIDAGEDGHLQRDELLRYLTSAEFRSSPLSYALLAFLADGEVGVANMFMGAHMRADQAGESASGARVAEIQEGEASVKDTLGLTIIDRTTGLTLREFIPSYIRTAMKLMYRSFLGSAAVKSGVVIKMLQHMSAEQGKVMDSHKSKQKIPSFVKTYDLNTAELLKPLEEFTTFNDFFYRRLKPGARPIHEPRNPLSAVCPADARTVVFPNFVDAGTVWIKGSEFTIERLIGPEFADLVPQFMGGPLVVARLAPQDYHRWHMPVTGQLGRRTPIDGALYTVNPIAVRQPINIYTENKRVVSEIHTEGFGTVLLVAVGATVVGSIHHLTDPGTHVVKGDEHGYFAFGGSTVLLLFQPGAIEFDEDLVKNSQLPLETLTRVGMSLGRSTGAVKGSPSFTASHA